MRCSLVLRTATRTSAWSWRGASAANAMVPRMRREAARWPCSRTRRGDTANSEHALLLSAGRRGGPGESMPKQLAHGRHLAALAPRQNQVGSTFTPPSACASLLGTTKLSSFSGTCGRSPVRHRPTPQREELHTQGLRGAASHSNGRAPWWSAVGAKMLRERRTRNYTSRNTAASGSSTPGSRGGRR